MTPSNLSGRRLSPVKLTILFLSIIMMMSIIFSSVFYTTSVNVLDQRVGITIQATHIQDPRHEIDEWIGSHSDQSKLTLGRHLLILNITALVVGAVVSYLLARIALRPIERALNEQDRFISDASHELRTPITAALLSNEVALKNKSLTLVNARTVLEENVSDMQELKRLSDELLDQTRAEHMLEERHVVHLKKLVIEAASNSEKLAHEKKIVIVYQVDDAVISTYPTTVSKILTILIDNAIKYSPEATTITVSGSIQSDHVSVSVMDEGIGISKTDQRHIFDRFYRSDLSRSQQEGYGLGLSIAKGLVLQIKGSIRVISSQGNGSTFIMTLPNELQQ